jgi:hypothetical protein
VKNKAIAKQESAQESASDLSSMQRRFLKCHPAKSPGQCRGF